MTFDTNLKTSVENILAVKMTAPVRKQSSLTPRLGGLGFRRTVDHANFAYSASWHEPSSLRRSSGTALTECPRSTSRSQWPRSSSTRQCTPSLCGRWKQPTSRVSLNASSALPSLTPAASSLPSPLATTASTPFSSREPSAPRFITDLTGDSHPRPGDLLPFVHADYQHLWRPCHLLLKVRSLIVRSHCSLEVRRASCQLAL